MRSLVVCIAVSFLLVPDPPQAEACFFHRCRKCVPVARSECRDECYKIYVAEEVKPPPKKDDPVFQWVERGGPYATLKEAQAALTKYHSGKICVACGTPAAANYVCICPCHVGDPNHLTGSAGFYCPKPIPSPEMSVVSSGPCCPAPYSPRRFLRR
jgi:hypothetical protein